MKKYSIQWRIGNFYGDQDIKAYSEVEAKAVILKELREKHPTEQIHFIKVYAVEA